MADLRSCTNTEPHEYHIWVEEPPGGRNVLRYGKFWHVCVGVEIGNPEPPAVAPKENPNA